MFYIKSFIYFMSFFHILSLYDLNFETMAPTSSGGWAVDTWDRLSDTGHRWRCQRCGHDPEGQRWCGHRGPGGPSGSLCLRLRHWTGKQRCHHKHHCPQTLLPPLPPSVSLWHSLSYSHLLFFVNLSRLSHKTLIIPSSIPSGISLWIFHNVYTFGKLRGKYKGGR